jgi:hypothetical protein
MSADAPVSPLMERLAAAPARAGRILLACGAVAGPLFVLLIVGQATTRDGFDAVRHPLSMLSLGRHGWIQTANFLVCGLLILASVAGLRRTLEPGTPGRVWGTRLLAIYGIGLIWAGVFRTDPALGYPPGTPDGDPVRVSWHGMLHNFAPVGIGLALSAACLVFARRFAREGRRGWALYSVLAPVAYLGLGFAAFPVQDFRLMLLGGAIIWTWASALCLNLMTGRTVHAQP